MHCDYGMAEKDERLKENLIVNAYSSDIRKKLYALPNDTDLMDVIKCMETLEQAAREEGYQSKHFGIQEALLPCMIKDYMTN